MAREKKESPIFQGLILVSICGILIFVGVFALILDVVWVASIVGFWTGFLAFYTLSMVLPKDTETEQSDWVFDWKDKKWRMTMVGLAIGLIIVFLWFNSHPVCFSVYDQNNAFQDCVQEGLPLPQGWHYGG